MCVGFLLWSSFYCWLRQLFPPMSPLKTFALKLILATYATTSFRSYSMSTLENYESPCCSYLRHLKFCININSVVQCKPLNVIILVQYETDNINRMITISEFVIDGEKRFITWTSSLHINVYLIKVIKAHFLFVISWLFVSKFVFFWKKTLCSTDI
jgi:hypothetical protein